MRKVGHVIPVCQFVDGRRVDTVMTSKCGKGRCPWRHTDAVNHYSHAASVKKWNQHWYRNKIMELWEITEGSGEVARCCVLRLIYQFIRFAYEATRFLSLQVIITLTYPMLANCESDNWSASWYQWLDASGIQNIIITCAHLTDAIRRNALH